MNAPAGETGTVRARSETASRRKSSRGKAAGDKPADADRPSNASNQPVHAGFDIKTPKLPEAIDAAALGSGNFPYDRKLKRKRYEAEITLLQIELLKLQSWVRESGARVVIVVEGRDGAGKGGAIHRFTQHLNPRGARIVALSKPSDVEKGQWYFQRYAAQMPTRGEIVFFDRSWYNRGGVEPVMGFCTPEEHERFLVEAPAFEGMLVRDGVVLFKLFLSIGREMQMKRLHARFHDPLKRWKLSPIDFEAIDRFEAYSKAYETMLERTDTERSPWTIIRANDKLRTRLNAIRHVLHALPYAGKDAAVVKPVDPRIVLGARSFLRSGGEDGPVPQLKPARG